MKATTLTTTIITILLFSVIVCHTEDRYETDEFGLYVTTADFNNDGYTEFCVNNYEGNSISVFFNNGDGKFALANSYSTGKEPGKVAVGDFNNDGWIDMVIESKPASRQIFFNNGDGTFKEPTNYDTSDGAITFEDLSVADINNDGWLDILSSGTQGELLGVMINNGDGIFTKPLKYGQGFIIFDSPQVVDVNKDGFLDVFISHQKYFTEEVSLIEFFKNNGDGTFNVPVSYETLSTYSYPTFADINNDSFIDMLCNNPKTNNISVYYNKKDGSFSAPTNYDTGTYPMPITPADISNDGFIDLLVTNFDSQTISIFLNNGNGTFNAPTTYNMGIEPSEVVASDLNNDGWIDMVVSCNSLLRSYSGSTENSIWIYLNDGNGTFTESGRYGRGKLFIDKAESVDLNNDGFLDIIQCDRGYHEINGTISVFRNVGNGKFDNSGIDLHSDPKAKASSGTNVKIIVDLRTFPKTVNADLYFVMMNTEGKIYSGMGWNEGIAPAFGNVTLPPDVNLFDLTLLEFTIPSEKPPVSSLGAYTFAVGLFKPGTAEMMTNLTTTTLEVQRQPPRYNDKLKNLIFCAK